MKWLTLEYIKQHSRIDCDCENELLTLYAESAEEQVLEDIDRTYEELVAWQGSVPNRIIHASLMLVDFAYQQRTMVSNLNWSLVPYTYERLIKPFARLADRDTYDETSDDSSETTEE